MKFITLGLQCSATLALGPRFGNYNIPRGPFDWAWCPSKTALAVIRILLSESVEAAVTYMTTGFSYYAWSPTSFENFSSCNEVTRFQMNKATGLGIVHYTINEEFKETLRRRLRRLLDDIRSDERLILLYADAVKPLYNYKLDGIEYGLDATDDLLKIYDLIAAINPAVEIRYFCWESRARESDERIVYVPFKADNYIEEVANVVMWNLQLFRT